MIYFIHGPDRLIARESALAIAARLDPDGTSTSWLDGREFTVDRIVSVIGTKTFFGAPRIVIVSEFLARATKEADGDQSNDLKEETRSRGFLGLDTLIAAVPEENVLVLFEPSMASVPASLRTTVPDVKIVSGAPPRGQALLEWVERTAIEAKSRIDRRTAQRLVEWLYPQTWDRQPNNPRYDRPPDMALLTQEIEKLALAAHPGQITYEHVVELTSSGPDQRVFRFLDATLSGDLRSALTELERLMAAGEEPAMLLAQVLGQVELATVASAAGDKGADAVARDLGSIAPGRMSAVVASTRRQGSRPPVAARIGTTTDRELKTGRIRKPDDALHDFVLALNSGALERLNGRSW